MPIDDIKRVLDDLLDRAQAVTSRDLAEAAGISRQAAHQHLRAGVAEGRLIVEGAARATRYKRTAPRFVFARAGLEEHEVWREVTDRVPWLGAISGDEREAFSYAFTEMVNNAIEHSGGEQVVVTVGREDTRLWFVIEDDGAGAFEHFRSHSGLTSALDALQEISKGKATTDPKRHTGEGLFFTSKVASRFAMHAGSLRWIVDNETPDVAVLQVEERKGTAVTFELRVPVRRRLADVFAEYTHDFAFTRTRTVVKLFGLGREFVSRSEARRLLAGLERFQEVVVDFEGVSGIGQGFADEVFRVWASAHPEVQVIPDHMNAAVAFMVRRATAREA